jgi:hypothetical protein
MPRTPNLGDLPLLVITADAGHREGADKDEWSAMLAELAGFSTRSRHVVMEGVGHHINGDDPAQELVVGPEAIMKCLGIQAPKPPERWLRFIRS